MANTNLAVVEPREMKIVPNADLDKIKELQESVASLKAKLKKVCGELEPLEESCIAKIESGWRPPMGRQVAVDTTKRTAPKWKEAFIEQCGTEAAAAVIDATEPSITKHLLISNWGPEFAK
jgi:hypothetical protein